MRGVRRRNAPVTLAAASALLLSVLVPSPASAADSAPEASLVASYSFGDRVGASAEVPNSASGSAVGPATARNLQASDWTPTGLTLRGGAKTSTGDWVELPDDLLVGARAATITAEVKASAAMLNGFHFLWNIGKESSATEYFFSSLNCGSGRSPLAGIKAGGTERLAQATSCPVTANQWVNVTAVADGGQLSLYLDGKRVATENVGITPADIADQSLNTIGRAPWPDPLFQGAISQFRLALDAWIDGQYGGNVPANNLGNSCAPLGERAGQGRPRSSCPMPEMRTRQPTG